VAATVTVAMSMGRRPAPFAEHDVEQAEEEHHGQGGGHNHLAEHLHADGPLGHGQPGDVPVLRAAEFPYLALKGRIDVVAEKLVRQRQVQAQGLAVGRNHLPHEKRVRQGLVAHGQGFGLGGRRPRHEPFEGDGPRSGLSHVVHHRGRDHVHLDDPGRSSRLCGIVIAQGCGEPGQLEDMGQGLRREHRVRVVFLDDPDDDGVA
jgi:hypothetical protein